MVACSSCGLPVPDHPVSIEAAQIKPPKPERIRTEPVDHVPSYHDRLVGLERKVAAMQSRINELETSKSRRRAS